MEKSPQPSQSPSHIVDRKEDKSVSREFTVNQTIKSDDNQDEIITTPRLVGKSEQIDSKDEQLSLKK